MISPYIGYKPEIPIGKSHHYECVEPCNFACILFCQMDLWHSNPTFLMTWAVVSLLLSWFEAIDPKATIIVGSTYLS